MLGAKIYDQEAVDERPEEEFELDDVEETESGLVPDVAEVAPC